MKDQKQDKEVKVIPLKDVSKKDLQSKKVDYTALVLKHTKSF